MGMDTQGTIFDKILAGEIPCHRVYEDEHVLAFLDIGPLSRGHTLVIPKERKAFVHELRTRPRRPSAGCCPGSAAQCSRPPARRPTTSSRTTAPRPTRW